VALRLGAPQAVPALTLNMACASGLKAIQLADRSVRSGDADVVLVVAAENMSSMPHLARGLRWGGARRGDIVLEDGWRDGAVDPVCGMTMGETAEKLALAWSVGREAQDAWALESHRRAAAAWDDDRFPGEVLPVEGPEGRLERDETIRRDSTAERLAALRPSFVEDGTVTAGNSSEMADGAAALVVVSAAAAERFGVRPQGVLRSSPPWGSTRP
jgi:acetyl-CoA C-acetyltransferase